MLGERVRYPGDRCSPESDSEVGKPHRFSARSIEPPCQKYLIGQRTPTNISQRVNEVEKVEHAEGRD